MNIAFPFDFDARGQTASCNGDRHVRDMIEMLLFTTPGERVNRPDFGCGLLPLVFEGNSPEVAAALQFSVQGALQHWLGDLIEVRELSVTSEDASLTVALRYLLRRTGEEQVARLQRSLA